MEDKNRRCGKCRCTHTTCPPDCVYRPHLKNKEWHVYERILYVFEGSKVNRILLTIPFEKRRGFLDSLAAEAGHRLQYPQEGSGHVINQLRVEIAQLRAAYAEDSASSTGEGATVENSEGEGATAKTGATVENSKGDAAETKQDGQVKTLRGSGTVLVNGCIRSMRFNQTQGLSVTQHLRHSD